MKKFLAAVAVICVIPGAAFAQGAGDAAAGKALWDGNNTQCKNCHGKDGDGAFGPDLAGRGLSASEFQQAVRHPWGIMPAFVDTQVSDTDIANLAAYFASLQKVAQTDPWRYATPAAAPSGQQVLHDVGCAQCHGPTFDMPRALLGGVNADFALFKNIVYTHTVTMPQVEEELGADAGRPPPAPGAPPGILRMGNFNPTRVSEDQLKAIYDWSKNDIGFRPSLQGRLAPPQGATYTLTVTNAGLKGKGMVAQGVKVGLIIPAGIDVVSTTGAGYKGVHMDDAAKGNVAEWDVAKLSPHDSLTYTITLSKPSPAGPDGIKGMITWAKPAPKSGPNLDVQAINPPQQGGARGGPG